MAVSAPIIIIQAITELEPVAQQAIIALIDHFRKQKNLAPIDWTALDAQFQKDLAAAQAAEKQP